MNTAPPRPKPSFNLLRRFAAASLAVIAAIAIGNGILLTNFVTKRMLDREAHVTMEFLMNVLQADGSIGYLADPGHPELAARFEGSLQQLTAMPDVQRINVYSRDRTVLWSTDRGLIARKFSGNEALDEALRGELAIESGSITDAQRHKPEHVGLSADSAFFIETYIPIRTPGSSEVLGVFELYKAPVALTAAIRDGHRQIWLTAFLGALALYLTLFWIVRSADRKIKDQHQRLLKAETMAAVGELASTVAHNIRNPLASIRSSAELALEMPHSSSGEQARDIIASVDRIEEWLRDLVSFAQVDAIPSGPVDAGQLMQHCFRKFAHEFERCGIDSEVSGGGIAPEHLAKLFTLFFTTKPQGLGIGLTLAHRAIGMEHHAGGTPARHLARHLALPDGKAPDHARGVTDSRIDERPMKSNRSTFRSRGCGHWFALCAALVLSGCASPLSPGAAPAPVPAPAAWSIGASSASAPTPLAQWWQRFDDPLLSALVAQALQANTTVRSAQAALLQARALRDVAAGGLLPTVTASGSAQRNHSAGNTANAFRAGFDASWEADVFGATRSAVNAADADARAAGASLADVQVSIAAEVAATYIELRGFQARLAIARSNLAGQRETEQITAWRVQAGLASSLDLEQARAASAQTAAQVPTFETGATQARNALAVLTGRTPQALQARLAEQQPLLQPPEDVTPGIPAQTLRQRPDVRTAEHRIAAALARVAQADAARYPSFHISGSLALGAATLGGLGAGGSAVSALLAGVTVPLFNGGALAAQVRAQEAALEQARVAYQATVLTALKDVEDSLVALQGDRERLALLQVAAEAAGNADLLARQRYASGLIDFRAVLDTQRTLLATQDGVETTRANVNADHVRLYKALGGGWPAATATANLAPSP